VTIWSKPMKWLALVLALTDSSVFCRKSCVFGFRRFKMGRFKLFLFLRREVEPGSNGSFSPKLALVLALV